MKSTDTFDIWLALFIIKHKRGSIKSTFHCRPHFVLIVALLTHLDTVAHYLSIFQGDCEAGLGGKLAAYVAPAKKKAVAKKSKTAKKPKNGPALNPSQSGYLTAIAGDITRARTRSTASCHVTLPPHFTVRIKRTVVKLIMNPRFKLTKENAALLIDELGNMAHGFANECFEKEQTKLWMIFHSQFNTVLVGLDLTKILVAINGCIYLPLANGKLNNPTQHYTNIVEYLYWPIFKRLSQNLEYRVLIGILASMATSVVNVSLCSLLHKHSLFQHSAGSLRFAKAIHQLEKIVCTSSHSTTPSLVYPFKRVVAQIPHLHCFCINNTKFIELVSAIQPEMYRQLLTVFLQITNLAIQSLNLIDMELDQCERESIVGIRMNIITALAALVDKELLTYYLSINWGRHQ